MTDKCYYQQSIDESDFGVKSVPLVESVVKKGVLAKASKQMEEEGTPISPLALKWAKINPM